MHLTNFFVQNQAERIFERISPLFNAPDLIFITAKIYKSHDYFLLVTKLCSFSRSLINVQWKTGDKARE